MAKDQLKGLHKELTYAEISEIEDDCERVRMQLSQTLRNVYDRMSKEYRRKFYTEMYANTPNVMHLDDISERVSAGGYLTFEDFFRDLNRFMKDFETYTNAINMREKFWKVRFFSRFLFCTIAEYDI